MNKDNVITDKDTLELATQEPDLIEPEIAQDNQDPIGVWQRFVNILQ